MQKVILIPQWVKKALVANDKTLVDALNPEIISSTLSDDDVGFYIFINESMDLLKDLLGNSFLTGRTVMGFSEEQLVIFKDHVLRYEILNSQQPLDVIEALFGNLSEYTDTTKIDLEVVELNEDTIGIIPIYNENNNGTKDTINKLVEILDKKMIFADLCTTSIFKQCLTNI